MYRTDLAAEVVAQVREPLPGLRQREETMSCVAVETVEITGEETARQVGKPPGTYLTVTTPPFHTGREIPEEELCAVAQKLADLLPQGGLTLVVGLGNSDITPDAIGPRTAHRVLATRHITGEMKRQAGLEQLRGVAVLAPGVLGQTGIETSEIVGAVVRDIRPDAVVVVDALAARNAARLGTTIQLADTGISPGSGVMNARKELSRAVLGVPVVSVGIPTVVDATTLAGDLLEGEEDQEKLRLLFEPRGQQMMITPREIDALIAGACKTLALIINKALQPELSLEEISFLTA